ncbi:MAG: small multi-drug export protein [Thermoplasmata archaeon]|nr:small multi-drug export protein [Thermoplasmata archaeon]
MEGGRSPDADGLADEISTKRKLLSRLLETDIEKKDRTTKIFQFIFPFIVLLILITTTVTILYFMKGWDEAYELLYGWIFYTVPPLGKETIIPTRIKQGVPPFFIGFATTMIDLCFCTFLIWNYDWVKKLPVFGPALGRTEEKGRKKAKKSWWFKRATFTLTTLFVLVPFNGSGGVGGTVLGRIVGMKPYRVLLAVFIGSVIGSFSYAYLTDMMMGVLDESIIFNYILEVSILNIVAVVLAVMLIIYVVRFPKEAAEKSHKIVDKGLILTEETIKRTEVKRKAAADAAVNRTKTTTASVLEFNRRMVEGNLELTTKPIEKMGPRGEEVARRTKEMGLKGFDSAQKMTAAAIDTGLDLGMKTASLPFKLAHEASIETIEMTREGMDEAKEVFIDTSQRIGEAARKPREMVKGLGKKRGPGSNDQESS